ncbi:hypothetical protein MY3296_006181 [Beauveria thailandica]
MGKGLAQQLSVTQSDVAGGVAVVLHLTEQAKKGRSLREIVMIETRDVLSPGLAFSTDCQGTILNMHSDTMGIFHGNPRDYTQWRESLKEGPFPSRVDYGKHLQERWIKAIEEARVHDITITTVQAGATDIDKAGDTAYKITINNQTTLTTAHYVVLALGNFTGSANSHLLGKAGYFPNPWPTTQLKSIPPTAHVLIVGSRLAAVDAALYLSENGHQGAITFLSRSGKLPRVEGNPNESLLRLTSSLIDEISLATNGDWSWMLEKDCPMEQLETDLIAAQEQRVRWQSILNDTALVIERYWNSISSTSQQIFLEKFNMGVLETSYVIGATGQECHTQRINSPLVQSAVHKGLLTPHVAGGVEVDFQSLQADKGLYVMGSVTRGTHFYVSATNRVAAHASRIAKSLTCEPFSLHLHTAIFVGGDLVSHLTAGKLVPELIQAGHVPYLVLVSSAAEPEKQKGELPDSPELGFFENELLQEHVIPYFKHKDAEDAKSPPVRQLASKYGILVQQLPVIRDKSFPEKMGRRHIDMGLTLVSTDSFSDNVLGYFSSGKKLLHLHSENLSSYRGATTGHVIDICKHAIDHSKSTLACMSDVFALGIDMAMCAAGKIARGEYLGAVSPIGGKNGRPSKEELEEYAASIVQILVDSFASAQNKDDFQSHILRVVREWSDKNYA